MRKKKTDKRKEDKSSKFNDEIDFAKPMIEFKPFDKCELCGSKVIYRPLSRLYLTVGENIVMNILSFTVDGILSCTKCNYASRPPRISKENLNYNPLNIYDQELLRDKYM